MYIKKRDIYCTFALLLKMLLGRSLFKMYYKNMNFFNMNIQNDLFLYFCAYESQNTRKKYMCIIFLKFYRILF